MTAKVAESILILTPAYNDSYLAVEALKTAGVEAIACSDISDLNARLALDNYGGIIVSEEAIGVNEMLHLQKTLETQPPWSDIPIILLISSDVLRAIELFSNGGNISLLERPFTKLTLIRSAQTALRARRKQYEVRDLITALNSAKEEAEKANTLKTQFLANMSHEIRTPIGAILGFTDLMKNPLNPAEENLKYMGIVERNSQQLLRLIDDILDLSKVEAGKMSIEKIEFSLVQVLADFLSIMSFKAAEKGISFRFKIDTLMPNIMCSDPVRIRQILTNIVGNALKFTDRGFVELTVSYHEPVLKFTVRDTGVGISKLQEANLFQPFSQADTSTTRRFGGTGLGLVLSRRLAETLDGRLNLVHSEESSGSTFVIEINTPLLPHAKLVTREALTFSPEPAVLQSNTKALAGLKILLIEDSPDNQMLIKTYLRKEGADVTSAFDGSQGVELALSGNFDLLLMDIQMPVLDGHKATKKLRDSQFEKPIVALTAHAMKEERIRCFESGFNEFLTKPVQRDILIEVLSRYVR